MKRQSGKIRIIAGLYKGRYLYFPDIVGLRPTPERIRETIFNWLRDQVNNGVCLDLFAGSGALGLEALSRGAKKVILIEQDHKATKAIQENIHLLKANCAKVICSKVASYLSHCHDQFDIIFLDPPYKSDLVQISLAQIAESGLINPNGWIYFEQLKQDELPNIPINWHLHRTTKAGKAKGYLYQVQSE